MVSVDCEWSIDKAVDDLNVTDGDVFGFAVLFCES